MSMDGIEFGNKPGEECTIYLTEKAGFTATLSGRSTWAEGTAIWIEFPAQNKRWDAIVAPGATPTATWKVAPSETGAAVIPKNARWRMYFQRPDESPVGWFIGTTSRVE